MKNILKNTLFWKQSYDTELNRYITSIGYTAIRFRHEINNRRFRELRAYWRDSDGQKLHLTPEIAAFRTFQEFADWCYQKYKTEPNIDVDFQRLAAILADRSPIKDEHGTYKGHGWLLNSRWKEYDASYSKGVMEKHESTEQRVNEVSTYRFTQQDIDSAWKNLNSGKIPKEAAKVWDVTCHFNSAHEIAEKTNLSLRTALLWAIVFREHGLMKEEPYFGNEQKYLRAPSEQDSREAVLGDLITSNRYN